MRFPASTASYASSIQHAAARSAGKLYFGTATNNYQLNDIAYLAVLDNLAMFGQLTPAKTMKWVRTPWFSIGRLNLHLHVLELH